MKSGGPSIRDQRSNGEAFIGDVEFLGHMVQSRATKGLDPHGQVGTEMKNQFFGDKRDYFKYAFLEGLMEGMPELRQLTCIWMLTEPIPNRHGNRNLVPLRGNEVLADFLFERRSQGRLDVREITTYFSDRSYKFNSYGDDPRSPFGFSRDEYFDGIPEPWCRSALVFVDPDNGLEPSGGATSAHITATELTRLHARLVAPALLVMYQHLPRRPAQVFWPETARRLESNLGCSVSYLAEESVAFFVAPRGAQVRRYLQTLLPTLARAEALSGRTPRRLVGGGDA
jgi:hypothetical protein